MKPTTARFLGVALALAAFASAGLPPTASVAAETNLLANPGFEAAYSAFAGEGELQVSSGWTPWYGTVAPAGTDPIYFHRPEYKNATAPFLNRVHGGCCAQQVFTFYSIHVAGVYQRVSVNAGTRLRFGAYGQVWSSQSDDPNTSVNTGLVWLKVGIDPYGGTNPLASSVIWSPARESYDAFAWLQVEATAASSAMTVFTYSAPTWPVKHNDVYWDDASLVAIGTGVPGPGASATPATGGTATTIYVVQRGDYLSSIARRFGTTVSTLLQLNPMRDPDVLYAGTRLVIPAAAGPAASPTAAGQSTATEATVYAARPGDSLNALAKRFGTTAEALAGANGISPNSLLYVGQVLRLPANASNLPDRVLYTVQRGDSLATIARRFGTTVSAVYNANSLTTTVIRIGQVLVIP